jgi:predicted transcriptional regulator of viral defense system
VTVKELQRFAEVQLGINNNRYLYKTYLRYLLQHGHINRHRKGLYSIVDVENPDFLPEMIIMASRLRDPYYLGYTSALEIWGAAPVIYSTYTVSVQRQDYFSSFNLPEKNPKYTINATMSSDFIHGLRKVKYQEEEVIVSSPARTLIEIINRPQLIGGWAELIRALYLLSMDFKPNDLNEVIELLELNLFKKKSLVGRVGYLLEVFSSVGTLSNSMEPLEELRAWVNKGSPVYLVNRNVPEKVHRDKRWNIFIPMDFHERYTEGQQIYPNLEPLLVS